MTRQELEIYISQCYSTDPEYLWISYPSYAVFRHANNQKWFAVIMNIAKEKLGLASPEAIDVLNVKCDPILIGSLREETGFYPAITKIPGTN